MPNQDDMLENNLRNENKKNIDPPSNIRPK